MDKNKHDLVFLEMLESIKKLSDDSKTQVATLIVNGDNDIISYGSNSLPNGATYNEKRCTSPLKDKWILHAERNAIYKAARLGITLKDTKMYCTYFPCADCSRAIIQAGVKKLYTEKPDFNHHKWGESWIEALIMLRECGVEVIWTNEVTHWTVEHRSEEDKWYLIGNCENGPISEEWFNSKSSLMVVAKANDIQINWDEV